MENSSAPLDIASLIFVPTTAAYWRTGRLYSIRSVAIAPQHRDGDVRAGCAPRMGFGASRARRQRAMAHSWSTFSIVELPTKARPGLNRGNWLCAANGIEATSASPRELRVRRCPRLAVVAVPHEHASAYPHPRPAVESGLSGSVSAMHDRQDSSPL